MTRLAISLSALLMTCAGQSAFADTRPLHDFEVQAVSSELMLIAETCNLQDRFNLIMSQRGQEFTASRSRVRQYYLSHGGVRAFDRYITELANRQSMESLVLYGAEFCQYRTPIVQAAQSGADLQKLAGQESLVDMVYRFGIPETKKAHHKSR